MFNRKTKTERRKPRQTRSGRGKVFSYYSNQSTDTNLDTPTKSKADERRVLIDRKQHLRNLPTYFAVALIIMSVLYATTLDTQPKILIGQFDQSNSLVRSSSTYQTATQAILSKSIFNRNKLTIDTDAVARSIQGSFPEIDHATVSLPLLGRRPVIGLDPSVPMLILVSQPDSFIVGQDGRALVSTKEVAHQDLSKLPSVEDKSGLAIEQGKAALPKNTVEFVTTIMHQLNAKHMVVESITLPTVANELHVKLKDRSYYVKFNLQGDPKLQSGTLFAVMNRLSTDNTTPSEYIDVRIEERAYYK